MVGAWKSGISEKGECQLEHGCVGVPEEVQGSEVLFWIKAVVAHVGSTKGGSTALRPNVTGGGNTTHLFCGERLEGLPHPQCRKGVDGDWERGPVWFMKLDGGPGNPDLPARKHDFVGFGVHKRTETVLARGFCSPVQRRRGRSISP